ncbi:hypothetical protein V6Z11_A03G035400 [Gossypium hirsutum]
MAANIVTISTILIHVHVTYSIILVETHTWDLMELVMEAVTSNCSACQDFTNKGEPK